MPVHVTRVGDIGFLRVVGRLDAQGAAELERVALGAITDTPSLVLDLAEATDASAAALRVLVMLDAAMAHRCQALCICPADSLMRQGLEAASIRLRASYAPSLEAATALLSEPSSGQA
jgi:anti-anti-sigma regulatory factor